MNRRKFIRQGSLAGAGFLLLPSLFSSCKKTDLPESLSYAGKVAIIGAGISGLYAAQLLKQSGIRFEIFEASDRIGGRIRKDTSLSALPLDMGADVVRGNASSLYDLMLHSGFSQRSAELSDYYYFNGVLKTQNEAEENTFFNVMMQSLDSFESYTGADIDAYTYGLFNEVSTNVVHIYNALLANRRGSSLDRLGVYSMRSEAEKWTAGSGRFELKDKTLFDLVETTFADVIPQVKLNTPISTIDSAGSKIILTDTLGNAYEADKVILTVPLGALKNGVIAFNPPLPPAHLAAMDKLAMDRGIVVALKFSQRIWAEGARSIFGNGYIPEYKAVSNGRSSDEFILVGRVCSVKAEELAALGDGIIPALLDELDEILGNATSAYLSHSIQDWGLENYIMGSMSYDKPGSDGARKVFAQTIAKKIYMAGEAAHTDAHHGTIHGAMETALRAVIEIMEEAL